MRPATGPARSGPAAAVPRRELFVLCIFHYRPPLLEPFLAALRSPRADKTRTGFIFPSHSLRKSGASEQSAQPRGPTLTRGRLSPLEGGGSTWLEVRLAVKVRLLKEEICRKSFNGLCRARRLLLSLYEIGEGVPTRDLALIPNLNHQTPLDC
ncbi:hypothetical protein DBR06_SOUSAS10510129 [Sousa chinensis]|nr:hypothetical protein DBR06_SOUSAS10510129 [Sousa chinensis]